MGGKGSSFPFSVHRNETGKAVAAWHLWDPQRLGALIPPCPLSSRFLRLLPSPPPPTPMRGALGCRASPGPRVPSPVGRARGRHPDQLFRNTRLGRPPPPQPFPLLIVTETVIDNKTKAPVGVGQALAPLAEKRPSVSSSSRPCNTGPVFLDRRCSSWPPAVSFCSFAVREQGKNFDDFYLIGKFFFSHFLSLLQVQEATQAGSVSCERKLLRN